MIREKWHDHMDSLDSDIVKNAMYSSYCLHLMQDIVLNQYTKPTQELKPEYQIVSSRESELMNPQKGYLAYERLADEMQSIEIVIDHDSNKQGLPITKLDSNVATPLDMPGEYYDFKLLKKAHMVVRNDNNSKINIYKFHKNVNVLSRLAGAIVIDKTVFRDANDYPPFQKDAKPEKAKNMYIKESTSIVNSDGANAIIDLLPKYD